MTYDFSRFSPQSFERFVQALAVAALGPAVRVFGAGRDGAREATYEGRATLGATEWDGYVVFQAKHRLIEGKKRDNAAWLIGQINAELAKFDDPKRNLRRPDYYVLATNVHLSASAANAEGKGAGGIDLVTRHLAKVAAKLGIKDVLLWHADSLSALLDAHAGVRQTFSFWIQPGDVLAALLRQFDGPAQGEVLIPYLRHSLRHAREIKTRDIGQTIGRTVALEDVFVDLPIDQQAHTFLPFDTSGAPDPHSDHFIDKWFDEDTLELDDWFVQTSAVSELMRRGAERFEPQAAPRLRKSLGGHEMKGVPANRVVLLGGPGQGKSTIGQFLAQLCRARLLEPLRDSQSDETNQTIEAVLACARAERVPLTGPLRYPFHVELPRYADALRDAEREQKGLSILAHAARDIARATEVDVTAAMLQNWLRDIPAVILLDGLDEVPRSGNRDAVIKAIEQLLDTIHGVNADCLIFCTSRPQGYRQELSPRLWSHWLLEPLESRSALRLARRAGAVLVSEETRRGEILDELSAAAEEPTTAPLMTSPLQVMLLLQLVMTHNNIPKDRWTLFHRHYETMRDREIAKGGVTGQTIGSYRAQIDAIHQDAGYLLHLRAEGAGGANAYLTDNEFEALVAAQLARDGYEPPELAKLATDIANLATNRLVFLRSQVDGQVAFDVRSLQEFMAAARLTASPEGLIRERLEAIAGRAHWLHVFKIACSKIYASSAHEALRLPIVNLLDSLDAGDRSDDDRLLQTGARLALQLLGDGTAANVPLYRKHLIRRAFKVIDLHGAGLLNDLADVLDFSAHPLLEPLFREALSSPEGLTRRNAFRLLSLGYRARPDTSAWARPLLDMHWPSDDELLATFSTPAFLPSDPEFVGRLRAGQWRLRPALVLQWATDLLGRESETGEVPEGVLVCGEMPDSSECFLLDAKGELSDLEFRYRGIHEAPPIHRAPPSDAHALWHVLWAATQFAHDPSIGAAQAFLAAIPSPDPHEAIDRHPYPWPLRNLLAEQRSDEGENVAAALAEGQFGVPEQWAAAERRWDHSGLRAEDIIRTHRDGPMRADWAVTGSPATLSFNVLRSDDPPGSAALPLLAITRALPGNRWAHQTLFRYLARQSAAARALVAFLETLEPSSFTADFPWQSYALALVRTAKHAGTPALFKRLLAALPHLERPLAAGRDVRAQLTRAYIADPDRRFLLPPIAQRLKPFSDSEAPDLPPAAFEFAQGDTPLVRSAVAILRMVSGHPAAVSPETLQAWIDAPPLSSRLFLDHQTRGGASAQGEAAVLALCRYALTTRAPRLRGVFMERLTAMVEARPAPFAQVECAQHLQLPLALGDRLVVEDA